MARMHKSIAVYRRVIAVPRSWPMQVIVLYGPTGTGKTRAAYDFFGESLYSLPSKKGSGTYWDGYDGQETVLIDEVYGSRFSRAEFLCLLDRYQHNVPIHGGTVNFSSKRIVLTSNVHPQEWYASLYDRKPNLRFQGGALERRMTNNCSGIFYCPELGVRVLEQGDYEGPLVPQVDREAEDALEALLEAVSVQHDLAGSSPLTVRRILSESIEGVSHAPGFVPVDDE